MKCAGVKPCTVIDVGANLGQFAVAASRLFEGVVVHPIEPDPRTAARLVKILDPTTRQNVLITAVGDRNGEATFNVNHDSQVSSLLSLGADRKSAFPRSTIAETITVPIATLDALFGDAQLPLPILLKIDVQGFEDRVIVGAKRFIERVQWVLMEVSFAALYEGERDFEFIMALMKDAGFRFVRPVNFHLAPNTDEVMEMDALFERINFVRDTAGEEKPS